ncbi:replication protein A 70 kDa DNA-binding subunit [Tanacetum coccineum]
MFYILFKKGYQDITPVVSECRSHAIFTLSMEQKRIDVATSGGGLNGTFAQGDGWRVFLLCWPKEEAILKSKVASEKASYCSLCSEQGYANSECSTAGLDFGTGSSLKDILKIGGWCILDLNPGDRNKTLEAKPVMYPAATILRIIYYLQGNTIQALKWYLFFRNACFANGVSSYSVGQKRKQSKSLRWLQRRRATAHCVPNQSMPAQNVGVTSLYIDIGDYECSCEHCEARFGTGSSLRDILKIGGWCISDLKSGDRNKTLEAKPVVYPAATILRIIIFTRKRSSGKYWYSRHSLLQLTPVSCVYQQVTFSRHWKLVQL